MVGADDGGHRGLVHRAHGEVVIAPGVGGGVIVLGGQAQAQLGDRHDGLDAVDALDLRGERVDVLLRRLADTSGGFQGRRLLEALRQAAQRALVAVPLGPFPLFMKQRSECQMCS